MTGNGQSERRSERLEVRVPPSLRDRVVRAAALRGQTVASFVTAAVQDAAERAIENEEITRLRAEDFARLQQALDNPPEPTPALREAFERYKALGGKV